MPRFGKKGYRGYARAGVKPRPRKSAPRRRKLVGPAGVAALAGGAVALKKTVSAYNRWKKGYTIRAKKAFDDRVSQTDNITTAQAVVIGKPRPDSFQEKVSKAQRPPPLFKRNYAFSAECVSGRKGVFSMELNIANNNDLALDMQTYKSMMLTDTAFQDTAALGNAVGDMARFYIDSHKEKIRMLNSSSNSITGKIHLFAHKRDNDNQYSNTATPITPINMLMYYSTQVANSAITFGAGNESTVGNGFCFSTTAGNTNYQGVYNMPGSSINAAGNTASWDPTLSFSSPHIRDSINFWFRKVTTKEFSLKPGQQFNSSYIFNDLPVISREEQAEFVHIRGVSYSLVVEFTGGMVGDSTATTGNNVISSGDCQLSVIRESERVLGLKNYLRSKITLQTAPLATIAIANQVIINADTGVQLSGAQIDA